MNKVDTSPIVPGVGYPPSKKGFDFLHNSYADMINGLCTGLVPDPYDNTIGYCLSGLGHAGTIYFTGYIFFNGELFYCNGGDMAGYAHAARLILDVSNDPTADPCLFTDGSMKNVHNVRVLKLEDVAAGGFLLTSLVFLNSKKINTKIVDIGDWNMDTVPQVSINHGLTLSKIRGISVIIRNDADTLHTPLDISNYAASNDFPQTEGRMEAGATVVVLDKRVTGYFDNANYDSTSYNRGWITIQYID